MESRVRRRRPRARDTSEYLAFARRILVAAAERVGEADAEQLRELLELRAELDEAITSAVASLKEGGATWQDIGQAAGTTRQAALMRWGPKIG